MAPGQVSFWNPEAGTTYFNTFLESYVLLFWYAPSPQSQSSHNGLDAAREHECVCEHPTQLGQQGIHSLVLPFPFRRNHGLSSLALNCAALGAEWCQHSQSVPTPMYPDSCFVLFCSLFSSGNMDFIKALFLCRWPSLCSPGISKPQPRGTGTISQFPIGSTASTKVCLPTSQYTGGWGSSQILWFWIPQIPQRHCCSWIDVEFLFWGVGDKTRDVLWPCNDNITVSSHLLVEVCFLVISRRRAYGNYIAWAYSECFLNCLWTSVSVYVALKFLSLTSFHGNFIDSGSKFLGLLSRFCPYCWSHLPLHEYFNISFSS